MFIDTKNSSKILDLKPLLDAINTVAKPSPECEHVFSSMNNIVTPKKTIIDPSRKFVN